MDTPVKHSTANTDREDRRKSVRYPLTGAVQFQWHARDGQRYDGVGIARDIGKGGAFIESDSTPPVASVLRLTVTLAAESKSDVTLQLVGVGFVRYVRRDSCQKIGFGASGVFHTEVPISKV
jgi:hypothetical protein